MANISAPEQLIKPFSYPAVFIDIINPVNHYRGKLLLLSGSSGSGKTSLCLQVIQSAQGPGLQVSGVVSPGLFVKGYKKAIMVQAVRSGETRLLATPTNTAQQPGNASLRTPAWSFDPTAVAWGNQILTSALPADLFIIDELGPLEWLQNSGWTEAFPAIDSRQYQLCLLVTRPELLKIALSRWPDASVLSIASPQDAPSLHALIMSYLSGEDA